ncbi:ribonuclease H-like domain-containing protein [Tanacetum coccineum]
MLHIDLFGPTFVSSLMHNKYGLVVTDDYSRFTWVFFLASKDETTGILKKFITEIENLVDNKVNIIRCDNGTDFKNSVMNNFYEMKCIRREFSIARTPHQNGVAERRNRTLIKDARTMLADSKLPTTFWAEAVNTACYVQNRVLVVKPHNKTSYELFRGRKPSLSFMRPFGCHVSILNTLDHLGKFDGNSNDGFFIRYSLNIKAFRVYNIKTKKVEENFHVRFLEDKPIIAGAGPKWLFDIDVLTESMNYVPVVIGTNSNDKDDEGGIDNQEKPERSSPDVNTVGPSINTASTNDNTGSLNITTASPTIPTASPETSHADFFGDETELHMSNISTIYLVSSTPNIRIHKDHSLENAIGDEEPNKVIQALKDPSWIEVMQEELLNKKDERAIVIRNKARLVAQGYTQEEGIGYDEIFAPVARTEAIRLFSAYASFKDFIVYQMDVKSSFSYGKIEEEVYVCQPPGFEDPEFPDKVYKSNKSFIWSTSTPIAWYETLSTYLLDNGFKRGQIDKTFFIKRVKDDILLVQVYVDDIIFGSTRKEICTEFEKIIHKRFQMSYMGELTFSLDYMMTQKDEKSTTDVCHFWKRLISWQCKKQTIVANSTTEAKYVAAASCYGHVLWIQNQMLDYGYNFMNTKIFIDNESTICIVKNPVFYSRTKHIEIRHHFIRDSNKKKLIQMFKIHTDHNVSDLLTKAFDVGRFQYLIAIDETVIKVWEDKMERATTTASSLEAEQDSGSGHRCQDTILRGAEAQIKFEAASK